jgi:uncharacterized protein
LPWRQSGQARRGERLGAPSTMQGLRDDSQSNRGHWPATRHLPPTTHRSGDDMKGYFHLTSNDAGHFTFNLKAANHEVILTSQVYKTKQDALDGIESVRVNAPNAARFQRKIAQDHSPYFILLAENGQTLGRSEMYSENAAMENGIKSVMANGTSTFVKGLD